MTDPSSRTSGASTEPPLEVQFWKDAGEWQKAGVGMTREQEIGAAMVWSWLGQRAGAASTEATPPTLTEIEDALRESVTFRNIRAGIVDSEDVDCRGLALQLAHIIERNRRNG